MQAQSVQIIKTNTFDILFLILYVIKLLNRVNLLWPKIAPHTYYIVLIERLKRGICFFMKMVQPRPRFRLFLVFSNKQYNFYNKSMLKTSIQYTAPRWLMFVFQNCRVIVTYKLRFKDFFWEQTTNECKKTFSDSNEAKIWTFEHLFPQISDPFLTLITSRHDDASNVTTWWR